MSCASFHALWAMSPPPPPFFPSPHAVTRGDNGQRTHRDAGHQWVCSIYTSKLPACTHSLRCRPVDHQELLVSVNAPARCYWCRSVHQQGVTGFGQCINKELLVSVSTSTRSYWCRSVHQQAATGVGQCINNELQVSISALARGYRCWSVH